MTASWVWAAWEARTGSSKLPGTWISRQYAPEASSTRRAAAYDGPLLVGVAAILALGTGIAWLVVTQLFEFEWLPHWPTVLATLGGGLALVLAFAVGGSLPLLRARPAQALRAL